MKREYTYAYQRMYIYFDINDEDVVYMKKYYPDDGGEIDRFLENIQTEDIDSMVKHLEIMDIYEYEFYYFNEDSNTVCLDIALKTEVSGFFDYDESLPLGFVIDSILDEQYIDMEKITEFVKSIPLIGRGAHNIRVETSDVTDDDICDDYEQYDPCDEPPGWDYWSYKNGEYDNLIEY